MLEIFQKGGPLMYPILLCSVLGMAIFFERLWTYARVRKGMILLSDEIEKLVQAGKLDEAHLICRRSDNPLGRILAAAFRLAGRPRSEIKTVVEEVGGRESAPLERYLGLLGTLATISPLLGLLGTVLGMIEAFTVIATEGVGTPATLGSGISKALITTAAGLSVAIPLILVHRYLSSRVDRMVIEMEESSLRIADLLGE